MFIVCVIFPEMAYTMSSGTLLNHAVYGVFIQRQPMRRQESTADRSAALTYLSVDASCVAFATPHAIGTISALTSLSGAVNVIEARSA